MPVSIAGMADPPYVAFPKKEECHLFHLLLTLHPSELHDHFREHNREHNYLRKTIEKLEEYSLPWKLQTGGYVFCSPTHYDRAIQMSRLIPEVKKSGLRNRDIVVDAKLMGFVNAQLCSARYKCGARGQVKILQSTYLGVASQLEQGDVA